MDSNIRELEMALISLDYVKIRELCGKYSEAEKLADNLIMPALESIGEQWEHGKLALAQVYMSGKICDEILMEQTIDMPERIHSKPKLGIAVFEDFHTLGKKIVYSALRSAGYNIVDLGYGETQDQLLDKIIAEQIDILLLSVLMLPSALHIASFIKKMRRKGIRIKVVVGGAPFRFDDDLWKEIGADAMGKNAFEAIKIVKNLTGGINNE